MIIYFTIGFFITLFLFISAEFENGYFSETLGFKSFFSFVTEPKIIAAFLIIMLLWPIAIGHLIVTSLK